MIHQHIFANDPISHLDGSTNRRWRERRYSHEGMIWVSCILRRRRNKDSNGHEWFDQSTLIADNTSNSHSSLFFVSPLSNSHVNVNTSPCRIRESPSSEDITLPRAVAPYPLRHQVDVLYHRLLRKRQKRPNVQTASAALMESRRWPLPSTHTVRRERGLLAEFMEVLYVQDASRLELWELSCWRNTRLSRNWCLPSNQALMNK
jgi:hypothetical protein